MKIAIDSGNSYTKAGFFENGELKKVLKLKNEEFKEENFPYSASSIIISSVSNVDFSFLKNKGGIVQLKNDLPLPIKLKYKTPETLGPDRIAAAVGASVLFPENNCLIINAGTCITYDLKDQNNNYQGGSISPGIQMRYKALNNFTAKLPLLDQKEISDLTGKSTNEAIASGVLHGVLAEVNGIILEYQELYPTIKIILTGGDADFFETKLKGSIFAIPDLILKGLNRILEYNAAT